MKTENIRKTPLFQMTGEQLFNLLKEVLDGEYTQSNQNLKEPLMDDKKLVYGIRGIANLFNCSISTANRIKKRGVIDEAIIQHGRTIIVDAEKALELLKNDSQ